MDKKKRGFRPLTVVIILICLAVLAAVGWGVATGISKLSEYGNSAKIGTSEEPSADLEDESEQPDSGPDPMEALPKNTYSKDGFYEFGGIKRYYKAGVTGTAGIDVSSYQGEIDWQAVRDAGIDFAMIRVGYRGYATGELDLDNCYEDNVQGALEAGVQVGVYFFSQALTEEEAVEEAEFVLKQIDGYDIQYPVIFDWEEMDAVQARTDEMNMLLLTSCALAFCQTIEEAGYEAGIYFNQTYGYQQLNLPSLQDYVFWLAQYEDTPSFVYDFQIWQYTNEGTVPGIEEKVDLNIAFGRE